MVKSRIGSDGTVGMMVRMSEGLRDRVKEAADANGRSQNSEIVATLEREYPAPTDVMYIHLDNIRRVLDKYERETDPKERLRLQTMVECMVTLGHDFHVFFEGDGQDLPETVKEYQAYLDAGGERRPISAPRRGVTDNIERMGRLVKKT